jgi:pseudouridine synthase
LILLTDDGALTHLLTHPSHEFEKRYLVETDRLLSDPALEALRSGVDLGDYVTHPATVERQREYRKLIIGIHEGKNRQIRRMIEAVGAEVKLLKRLSIGPLEMGDLKLGAWRYLTAAEIEALKALK